MSRRWTETQPEDDRLDRFIMWQNVSNPLQTVYILFGFSLFILIEMFGLLDWLQSEY